MAHSKSGSWGNEGGENLLVDRYMLKRDKEEGEKCSTGGCSSGGCGGCSEESDDEWTTLDSPPADEVVFSDNGSALFERFRIEIDPTHKRFAGGYQWFCRNCGQPCSSMETWFPCKEKFITVKVVCHLGCHNHWRLKIHPSAGQVRLNS